MGWLRDQSGGQGRNLTKGNTNSEVGKQWMVDHLC